MFKKKTDFLYAAQGRCEVQQIIHLLTHPFADYGRGLLYCFCTLTVSLICHLLHGVYIIQRHSGHPPAGRIRVARYGEVDNEKRASPAAAACGLQHLGRYDIYRSGGGDDDDVDLLQVGYPLRKADDATAHALGEFHRAVVLAVGHKYALSSARAQALRCGARYLTRTHNQHMCARQIPQYPLRQLYCRRAY